MKTLSLAVVLALIANPLFAADAIADKKAHRTLKEIIELAVQDGKDGTLPAAMAEKLGLGAADYAEKKLRYKQSATPDKQEHTFVVVMKDNKPVALELVRGTGQIVNGKTIVDGFKYKASLSGKLEKAFHNKGVSGEIKPEEIPIKDAAKDFKQELDFHLKRALDLGLEPTK